MTDLLKKVLTAIQLFVLRQQHANENARRDYYLSRLAEKLKDPAFRSLEGFSEWFRQRGDLGNVESTLLHHSTKPFH